MTLRLRQNKAAGLIALNAVLLVILALVTWAPRVQAGGSQPPGNVVGDYIMVGGDVNAATNAIFVLDQRSGFLLSFIYEQSAKGLRGLDGRSVADDGRRARPGR